MKNNVCTPDKKMKWLLVNKDTHQKVYKHLKRTIETLSKEEYEELEVLRDWAAIQQILQLIMLSFSESGVLLIRPTKEQSLRFARVINLFLEKKCLGMCADEESVAFVRNHFKSIDRNKLTDEAKIYFEGYLGLIELMFKIRKGAKIKRVDWQPAFRSYANSELKEIEYACLYDDLVKQFKQSVQITNY